MISMSKKNQKDLYYNYFSSKKKILGNIIPKKLETNSSISEKSDSIENSN